MGDEWDTCGRNDLEISLVFPRISLEKAVNMGQKRDEIAENQQIYEKEEVDISWICVGIFSRNRLRLASTIRFTRTLTLRCAMPKSRTKHLLAIKARLLLNIIAIMHKTSKKRCSQYFQRRCFCIDTLSHKIRLNT